MSTAPHRRMTDADISAFPAAPLPPGAARRHGAGSVLAWLSIALLLLGAALAAALLLGLGSLADEGVEIFVNGEPWADTLHSLPWLLGGTGLLVALLLLAVLVPVIVLFALLLAAGGLALGLGSALLAIVLTAAVLLSPLLLLGALLWWALRRRPAAGPVRTTMAP